MTIADVLRLIRRFERFEREGYHLPTATSGERSAYSLVRAQLIRIVAET